VQGKWAATNNFTPNPTPPPSPSEPPASPKPPPSPLAPPLPTWVLGAPGGDCNNACSNSGGRICAEVGDITWPTSAELLPKEHCDGLGKTDRCDIGESPIKTDTTCHYCSTSAWYTPPNKMCDNKAGNRVRICPCKWPAPPHAPPSSPVSLSTTCPVIKHLYQSNQCCRGFASNNVTHTIMTAHLSEFLRTCDDILMHYTAHNCSCTTPHARILL